jgi:hypothetical protein
MDGKGWVGTALASAIVAVLVAGVAGQAPAYQPPRTPWGDPDLQGKWPGTEMVGVPMQRDQKLGTRNVLTEERVWTYEFPLKRDDGYGFYEYACHEGNYSLFNILSGHRADEKAAAEAAAKGR